MDEYKNSFDQTGVQPNKTAVPTIRKAIVQVVWIIAIFAFVEFLFFGFVFYKMFSRPFDTLDKALSPKMDITQTFIGYAEQTKKVQHLLLLKTTRNETDRKEYSFSHPWIMNGKTLSSAVVEVRAPVTYSYYVDMKGSWKIICEGDTITIVAPKIQVEEPATDLSRLETHIESGKLILNEAGKLEELRKQFYPDMIKKAMGSEYMDSVREDARRSLAEFANGWIVADLAKKYPMKYISVRFEDEEKFPLLNYSVKKY
ncbi:MAG: DUF4230 domain-containing protein [Lentisphaerae bacterium]|nr:DUF4230 domain-containing protein [Lentisphaerota bacterium]